ncbi:MAG: MBL fold metallo-hydrolase [Armatimonadota bacterium]|nr:MBL fold metallo-hydrolase [Armatimonadota bacterium]MDR7452214.1 MBL fold metallo-hydrolase [Armatimonadota bacterium]MDR7466691.1 MBL fold metallo-hydrolase [Armatimonadota bacterium]MDR7498611.1 MBL fold metallo-hydrolase [Armatimonadota bacterium]MDR7504575.1 MBL fold metallo-hydrolase [Armatimonadota bacterium]
MRLTVLGKWSPYPPPGGACPGYLVASGEVRILLDCGSGAVAAMLRVAPAHRLSAAVITHLHPDHFSDIYALQNALRFGRYPDPPAPPLPLFAPRGAGEFLAAVLPADTARRDFRDRFDFRPIEAGAAEVDGVRLRFTPTTHPMPCHAVEVSAGGRRLVYTADTGPSPEVERLAAGADLLLAECALVEEAADLAPVWGHLTGSMAGAMAARAGVGRLLLTHFFTPHHALQESVAAAAKEFGAVLPVDEGSTYEI